MSWFSKAASTVGSVGTNILGNIFGNPANQIPGTNNPFSQYSKELADKLLSPTDLTSGFKPVDTTKSDTMFNNLLSSVGAQDVNLTQQMQDLLKGIDIDTSKSVGSLKSDFLDRGLGGPSQMSDIESAGLGDLYANAGLAKDQARLALGGKELDLINSAYGTGYKGALDTSTTNATLFNDLLKGGANLTADKLATLANLFTGAATNQREGYMPATPDLFTKILGNTQINLGKKI
jgi:hypothetical protein